MGRITRLPPDLANQIAAGEVVERPASVVKELVENAIDAGATRISITIELGGKRLIRVEDDGEGMDADDALLALERHATSKIHRAEDLGAIETLGFRGEALPSIASVSRLILRTRAQGTSSGAEVRISAGVAATVKEIGLPEGTSIEVGELFYNLPARRKFLKSDAAESAQISRIVTQLALGYASVGFTLTSAGRRVLQCPPAANLAERFFQLYGHRPDLIEVRKDAGGVRLFGYVAALAEQGPVRGPQNVFVNRRIVRDRTIAHAIAEAYSAATIKERSPEVHLFVEVPPTRVDVNVHPTKAEVRFLDQSMVHEVLRRGLAEALGQGPSPSLHFRLEGPAASEAEPRNQAIPGVLSGQPTSSRWAPLTSLFARRTEESGLEPSQQLPEGSVGPGMAEYQGQTGGTDETGGRAVTAEMVRPMLPLGQFRDTFIIAVDAEGIAIIDQHVAHERVLYEQVLEHLSSGRLESQRLLHPLLIDLSASQREALAAHHGDLERFGFELEDFGGDSVRITAIPALLGLEGSAAAVRALGEDLEGLDKGDRVEIVLKKIAATTACHAAVKANDRLTFEKMTYILEELRRTAYSTVCPHGRPVLLRLTRREVERNFQRI